MTDQYAVSLPYAANVALLSIFSGSKAQLGSMLTGKNKLRNVALDAQGGRHAYAPAPCTPIRQSITASHEGGVNVSGMP